jgi:uncharacterized protein YbjT (DUF2867 family)
MKIFVAGAAGAIGRHLIPDLIADGHEVIGTTRTPDNSKRLRALGATPVIMDGLDRRAVMNAVVTAEPEVVIHEMTALTDIRGRADRTAGLAAPGPPLAALSSSPMAPPLTPPPPCQERPGSPLPDPAPYPRDL